MKNRLARSASEIKSSSKIILVHLGFMCWSMMKILTRKGLEMSLSSDNQGLLAIRCLEIYRFGWSSTFRLRSLVTLLTGSSGETVKIENS